MAKNTLPVFIYRWIGWFLAIFLVACKTASPTSGNMIPSSQIIIATETTAININNVPTVSETPTFFPTNSSMKTPVGTVNMTGSPPKATMVASTPSPNPTVPPMQKIAELPIDGVLITTSMNGLFVASVNNSGELFSVYDVSKEKVTWEFDAAGYFLRTTTLAISPDGDIFATGGVNEDVFVWDTNSDKLVYNIPVPYYTVDKVTFSQDGRFLAISAIETEASQPGVMVWDLNEGKQIPAQIYPQDYNWYVMSVIFIPGQTNLLAMTTANLKPVEEFSEHDKVGGLYFWNVNNYQLQEILAGVGGKILTVSASGQIVGASIDDSLQFWDIQNTEKISSLDIEYIGGSRDISISDSEIIANVNKDGLTIWNFQGELVATLQSDKEITDVEFLPDGSLLVAYFAENTPVEVWKIVDK